MSARAGIPARSVSARDWLVPSLLVLLALMPSVAGAARLAELAAGGPVTAGNARFMAMPLPVVLHILAAVPFSVVGAFQFSVVLRARGGRWHRIAGRLLLPCGIIVALSGLWMARYYAWPAFDGTAVYYERIVAGTWMLVTLLAATGAIVRRDFRAHGEWMTRAYAIGLGAGTQVLTHLPWLSLVGELTVGPRAVMMGAAWVINLGVAEWVIQRRRCSTRSTLRLAGASA